MAILIIGARGQARVLIELMEQSNFGMISGLLDDDVSLHNTRVDGHEVMGGLDRMVPICKAHHIQRVVVAIGDNATRERIVRQVKAAGLRMPILVHPGASVANNAKLGEGTCVMAGAVVGTHVTTGIGCIINSNATVDHDCCLGDFVHCGPGSILTGNVTIGDNVLVGAGVTVIPEVCVGNHSILGAGSTVIRDVPSYVTAVGCPAKIIRHRQPAGEDSSATIAINPGLLSGPAKSLENTA